MKFNINIQAEATDKVVHQVTERSFGDEPRPEDRGLVRATIARFGKILISLGTSLERLTSGTRISPRRYVSDQGCSNVSDEIRKEMTV